MRYELPPRAVLRSRYRRHRLVPKVRCICPLVTRLAPPWSMHCARCGYCHVLHLPSIACAVTVLECLTDRCLALLYAAQAIRLWRVRSWPHAYPRRLQKGPLQIFKVSSRAVIARSPPVPRGCRACQCEGLRADRDHGARRHFRAPGGRPHAWRACTTPLPQRLCSDSGVRAAAVSRSRPPPSAQCVARDCRHDIWRGLLQAPTAYRRCAQAVSHPPGT